MAGSSVSGDCGLVRDARSRRGDLIGEYLLPANYSLGRHTHAHRGFALGLTGTYVAQIGKNEHALSAGDVLIFPDNAAHSEHAGNRGSHCLLVHLPTDQEDALDRSEIMSRDRVLRQPCMSAFARRLNAELRFNDDVRSIGLEVWVAEVLCELRRLSDEPSVSDKCDWVWGLREWVDSRIDNPPNLAEMAACVDRSREHVARSFRRTFGKSIGTYVRSQRMCKAAKAIIEESTPLAQIANLAGFADQSHFTRRFRQHFGMTPGQFRRRRTG